MDRATHDRFVWTDDDFTRSSDWLERLVEAGEKHGAAAVFRMFPGDGWTRRLVEPVTVLSFGLQTGLFWSDGDGGYP